MFRRVSVGIFAAAVALSPPIGQAAADDVSKKAGETWEAIKDYTVEKKNEAVAQGKKLVRDADTKIKELESSAAKVSGEAKTKSEEGLKELKAKHAQATRRLDELGKASAASWEGAKKGFADAYHDLHRAYEKAIAQFK